MLSSASFQKCLSISLLAMIALSLIYLHTWFVAWSRGETTGLAILSQEDYHAKAGVLKYVNPKIGTYGVTPNGNGGMIPSVGMPFGMTRWTPQTRENFISQCPYNDLDTHIHGFQATHQPAIWMGESGQVVLSPGVGKVEALFERRGHRFDKVDEVSTPYVYEVIMDAEAVERGKNLTESSFSPVPGGEQEVPDVVREGVDGRVRKREDVGGEGRSYANEGNEAARSNENRRNGTIRVAMTASSHVGRVLIDFENAQAEGGALPYVFVQATRQNWTGKVTIDSERREVYGRNPQRQDYALGPLPAANFSGYFVSRFSAPFQSYGIFEADKDRPGRLQRKKDHLGAYIRFSEKHKQIEVRTATSFVSIEQARYNLDSEAPPSISFEQAVRDLKQAWTDELGMITILGVNDTDAEHDPRTIFYTGLFHALQYPQDFSEKAESSSSGLRTFYSGYTDSIHSAHDSYYQSWSIWDTFRAEHSLLILFAPERVNSMMRSLIKIYEWAGRLPMWANIVETNIMIGTHVDAVIANALVRGFNDFDIQKAWEAVKKNAYVPPINDTELLYYDREGHTPDEVRAGLTTYMEKGYVANDRWAESASRTLDYAFDDHAAAVVAEYAGDHTTAEELRKRSMNYKNIFNHETGFMQPMNDNGTWAHREQGWAEGDDWIYTFSVMHDALGLAALMGGREKMKSKLDEYFQGGYNDHSNEPSHHAPYLYAAIGYPSSTQTMVREIAWKEYNATSAGLSGNEDLGQMSAWYIFTALGFYPVNPASDEYVVGSPSFEEVRIRWPRGLKGGTKGGGHVLVISAPGAPTKPYVKSLKVDGKAVEKAVLKHENIVKARRIEFEMADTPQSWGHW